LQYKSVWLKPDISLAIALVHKGDIKSAIVHFRGALRINPDHIEVKDNLAE